MDEHPEMVDVFPSDNQHFVMDVDSLEDLKQFEEKTGWHLKLPTVLDQADPIKTLSEPAYLALQRLVNKC
jgi:molybdenum cofactor cytidylyltransferase/nicotine blue oxidoreductase